MKISNFLRLLAKNANFNKVLDLIEKANIIGLHQSIQHLRILDDDTPLKNSQLYKWEF